MPAAIIDQAGKAVDGDFPPLGGDTSGFEPRQRPGKGFRPHAEALCRESLAIGEGESAPLADQAR